MMKIVLRRPFPGPAAELSARTSMRGGRGGGYDCVCVFPLPRRRRRREPTTNFLKTSFLCWAVAADSDAIAL